MGTANIIREIKSLPPEAQEQVLNFLAFLKSRYPSVCKAKRAKLTRLADEPFIGMWRTREDMRDSTAWVRSFRKREAERRK